MSSKEILKAVLNEDSAAIMKLFDQLMIEKLSTLMEDRRISIAQSLFEDGGRGRENEDDEDEELSSDDDSFEIEDDEDEEFKPFDIDGGE